ncbi:MAG: aspartate aminotransferase family protein [Treponema sp.]|jgi:4-aminobutyrate aminotransferase-like enzyme|nr:aspartate aminotransferase family protein [Treponema sp.]
MSNYPNSMDLSTEESLAKNVMFGGPWRGPLITRGEGVYCYDRSGKTYLDCESQAWSLNLGFGNREVIDAAFEQAKYVYHMKGGLNTFPRLRLVEKILSLLPNVFDRVSFEPSGSIANEAAMKIAMINIPEARYFISLYHAFHGNTLATAAAGWHATKAQGHYGGGKKYMAFMQNFVKVPNPYCYRCVFNKKFGTCDFLCAEQLRTTICLGVAGPVAAVILEPVQGSGGQIPCPPGYLERVREICDEFETLLIFDEMQCAFGRMGTMFASEYYGVVPDIFTIGKALANGFPISGTVIQSKLKGFQDGNDDNFTFCNNPMSQAAAIKTIEIIIREKLPENAKTMGAILTSGLKTLQEKYPVMGDVRGPGLHIGVEIVKDPVTKEAAPELASRIYNKALENGLIMGLGGSSPQVIKIKPPIIINKGQCEEFLGKFEKSIKEAVNAGTP